MNLISCLGQGYVITYVCKGGTLPNTQKQQQQNEQSFRIYFQHGWHKTRSALPKKDQVKLDVFARHCCCFSTSVNKMYSPQGSFSEYSYSLRDQTHLLAGLFGGRLKP